MSKECRKIFKKVFICLVEIFVNGWQHHNSVAGLARDLRDDQLVPLYPDLADRPDALEYPETLCECVTRIEEKR